MQSQDVLDQITFGLVGTLKENPHIDDVQVIDCGTVSREFLESWEETTACCLLPDDLKAFYATMNGLLIRWSVKVAGKTKSVGNLEVNPLESLTSISQNGLALSPCDLTLSDIDCEPNERTSDGYLKPHFDDKIFELSTEEGYGKVCLVYRKAQLEQSPQIWFLDRALQWFFLADNFRQYFRMLIIHLGIPGWQYMFSHSGLSPESKQWFSLLLPQVMTNNERTSHQPISNDVDSQYNKVDFDFLSKSHVVEKRKADAHKQMKNNPSKTRTVRGNANKTSARN